MFGQPSKPPGAVTASNRGITPSRTAIRGQSNAARHMAPQPPRGGYSARGGAWQAGNPQQSRNMGGNSQQTSNAKTFTSSSFKPRVRNETPLSGSSVNNFHGNAYQPQGRQAGNTYQYAVAGPQGDCSYMAPRPQGPSGPYHHTQTRGGGYNTQGNIPTRGGYPNRGNTPMRGGQSSSYPGRGGATPYTPSPAQGATAPSGYTATAGIGGEDWDTEQKHTVQPKKATNLDSQLDKSLHVLTVDVAGVRRWNKHKDRIPMMFELYGYLDSAITRNEERCKEFLLRDDRKEAIKCVFYEIDRQLPKMTRGQWQRCVGTLEKRTGRFKCISLRPMADGERRLVPKLIGNTATFMQGLTSKFRES